MEAANKDCHMLKSMASSFYDPIATTRQLVIVIRMNSIANKLQKTTV